MTIAELKELIEDLPDDAEVRIAHQPRWAFEYSVGRCAYVENQEPTNDENDEDADDDAVNLGTDAPGVLFIGEGSQLGYLPGAVASELGWR